MTYRLLIVLFATLLISQESIAQTSDVLTDSGNHVMTTAQDVSNNNPIRLTISKGAPSFDLPVVTGHLQLSEIIAIGQKNNLTLMQSEKSWSLSKYFSRSAMGKLGPSASVSGFFGASSIDQMLFFPTDAVMAAPMQPVTKGTSFHAIFAGVQPLFTGGRLLGGVRVARAQERQSLQNFRADKLSVVLKIKEAYWQAAIAEARLQVDSDYVRVKEQSTGNMKARMVHGKAPRADYLREESELAKARAQVNDDYRVFNTALLNLKVVMGVNITSLLGLKDKLEYMEVSGDLANYLVEAGQARPELTQAESKVSEMRAKRLVQLSKYSPQIYLYGLGSSATGRTPGRDETVYGRPGGTIGIIGGVTLFDSGSRFNELRAANVAIKQAQIAKKEVELKVAQEVAQSWIDLDLARRNVELARSEVTSATEDQRLFHARYLVGKSIVLEDFEAGVKLLRARLALLQAIYDYRVAEARLVWSTGKI